MAENEAGKQHDERPDGEPSVYQPAPADSSQVSQADVNSDASAQSQPADDDRPREIGGRKGPDPTRYGDWEKNGRCIDF